MNKLSNQVKFTLAIVAASITTLLLFTILGLTLGETAVLLGLLFLFIVAMSVVLGTALYYANREEIDNFFNERDKNEKIK